MCRSHQSFSSPHQTLPHPGLASNYLYYRCQLRTRWLSPTSGVTCPLAFVFFSMTLSTIVGWASCTVFTVTSTCTVLPAQLAGPVKLNPMSLALVQESAYLCYHLPKNKIASPGTRATSLVICSLGPSWTMSAISNPLHVWEGEGWLPPPLESLWHECNNASHCLGSLSMSIYPQVIENIWRAICSIVWIWRVLWEMCPSEMIPPLTGCRQYPLAHLHRMMEWEKYPSTHLHLP